MSEEESDVCVKHVVMNSMRAACDISVRVSTRHFTVRPKVPQPYAIIIRRMKRASRRQERHPWSSCHHCK